jgi:hypothetical protein
MSDIIVSIKNDISDLLDQWLNAERNGEQFPVPFDSYPEYGFTNALLALSRINELSRKVKTGEKEAFRRLSRKVYEIEVWRRSFVMQSETHHNILIEMCDAVRCSINHSQSISPTKPLNGHVYFLFDREVNIVKIGWSTDWMSRVSTIRGSYPRGLEVVKIIESTSSKLESDFHKKFKVYRLNGEWFKNEGKLNSFLFPKK